MCFFVEFRTSTNLTGFHVFALIHTFAKLHSTIFKINFAPVVSRFAFEQLIIFQ